MGMGLLAADGSESRPYPVCIGGGLFARGLHRVPYFARVSATIPGRPAGNGSRTTFTRACNTLATRRSMLRE